jgi:undecaprenyl-diphosphatase
MLAPEFAIPHGDVPPPGFALINDFARRTDWLHAPMLAFASYGAALFAVLILAGWWVARRGGPQRVAASIWAGAGTVLALGINQPLVNAIHEARPYTTQHNILVLAHRSSDFSSPSDHAVMAGAAAAGLWIVSRRLGVVTAILAVVMAFSRVYIAAHYPHDVLAGLVLGTAVSLLGWHLLRGALERLTTWLQTTALRALVTVEPRGDAGPAQAGGLGSRE